MFNPKEYTCVQCKKKFLREARIERYHPVRFCGAACIGAASKKHGMSTSSFYRKYRSIKNRCEEVKDKSYKNYGGRGILCEWKTFESFKEDMYESYLEHIKKHSAKLTQLDRINNDGNYSKSNCRWVTPKQNANNRSTNRKHIVDGKQYTLKELSSKFEINLSTLKTRFYVLGWEIEKACKTPAK